MALVTSKHLELQTNVSIRNIIHECRKITDARLKNQLTGLEIKIRAELTPKIIDIAKKLRMLT